MTARPRATWAGCTLALPSGWVDVPLDGRRRRAVGRLLRSAGPLPPGTERHLRRELDAFTARAAARGVESLHLCARSVDGVPLAASLTTSRAALPPGGIDAVQAALSSAGGTVERLPGVGGGAPAVLRASAAPGSVTYWCAGPRGTLLLLAFEAPVPELADAYRVLFDAVVATLRWEEAAAYPARPWPPLPPRVSSATSSSSSSAPAARGCS
ncbi:hypothetical protein [Motilibacter peucedani]|uniref:hypothetical protein n=1 Tax=Motilibacter peucedani TaxID=598650 RepID=UPI0011C3D043|nr:hypothetical protein [Motilibacter peucedani]